MVDPLEVEPLELAYQQELVNLGIKNITSSLPLYSVNISTNKQFLTNGVGVDTCAVHESVFESSKRLECLGTNSSHAISEAGVTE